MVQPPLPVGDSFWSTFPKTLGKVTMIIVALSLLTQAIIPIFNPSEQKTYLGLVITIIGVLIAYFRQSKLALIFLCIGPLASSLMEVTPVGLWSVCCFMAFYLTLNGNSAILVASTIGITNYVSEAIFVGSWLPSEIASPSIAALVAIALAAIGATIRLQRLYWLELERRTEDAISTRQSAINRGIAEERLRIARDLHDSVGHNIAVANMRIGSAEVNVSRDVEAVKGDLVAARESMQTVLKELQQILKVLRVGDAEALLPTPQHGQIPILIASVQSAGMNVEAKLDGLNIDLEADVSAAAYRITQEALTNAQKYGNGTVSISVDVDNDILIIDVSNRLAMEKRNVGGGNGLPGIRERAASVGGHLEVNSDDVIFSVRAFLPTQEGNN